MADVSSVGATFVASIKSVGTAVVMAGVGFYLHHRSFITKDGKRALALMSQQVTFPLYFFTKIIYCNQDWSDAPCPDVTSTLHDTWMLLLWPCFMVGSGLAVGKLVAHVTKTPKSMLPSVLAAVAFANNTALPITLLAVVHANFPSTSDLGRIDPTLFLSVYLVVYPILQWSLGGWILAPPSEDDDISDKASLNDDRSSSIRDSFRRIMNGQLSPIINGVGGMGHTHYRNVVNNKEMVKARRSRTHGLTSTDESGYMSEFDLEKLGREYQQREQQDYDQEFYGGCQDDMHNLIEEDYEDEYGCFDSPKAVAEGCPLLETQAATYYDTLRRTSSENKAQEVAPVIVCDIPDVKETTTTPSSNKSSKKMLRGMSSGGSAVGKSHRSMATTVYETDSIWETIKNILDRTLFQPPVIGALLGILCAVTPARGWFVDVVNRHSGAPLQWLFDGLYKIGQIAVPDNMLILGCNISASYNSYLKTKREGGTQRRASALPRKTMIGIVVGKMLIMPIIGITTTWILKQYVFNIPDEIAGAFYLVLMIVFLTPTANNVMIMIELADCDGAIMEGVANVIAMQYLVAPIILSLTMSVAIGVASEWS